jgi:hypothetical protein
MDQVVTHRRRYFVIACLNDFAVVNSIVGLTPERGAIVTW